MNTLIKVRASQKKVIKVRVQKYELEASCCHKQASTSNLILRLFPAHPGARRVKHGTWRTPYVKIGEEERERA
jgi:hypothetical protein